MKNITYINAGAGSGKTYTLTHKLAELLQNGDCAPSEVILTTFTELAASEFRQKARASLYEAKRPDIAAQLDAALIGTVHSVALRFVQKYWYLLGNSPEPKVMTDDDMATYISQSLAAHLTPERVDFFEQYTSYFGIDAPDFWRGELNSIIEQVNNYGIDLETSRQLSLDAVGQIFGGTQATVDAALLDKFLNYLCQNKDNFAANARTAVAKCLGMPEGYAMLQKTLKMMDANDRTLSNTIKNAIRANMGDSNYDLLAQQLGDYLKVAPGQWMCKMINHIYDIAVEWNSDFKAFKRQNHIIDYNDMEQQFLQLLKCDEVADEIRGTYKVVMVDEFQDSSPVQLDIFKRLAELVEHSYWVGDPKQSIYGFRGTDTQLVKQLVDQLQQSVGQDGIEVTSLPESWRSRPALVNLVSDCFVRAYDGVLMPNHVRLTAHRNDCQGLNEPLEHWNLTDRNQTKRSYALAARVKHLLDPTNNLQVVDKDSEQVRPIEPGDVAILCLTNGECATIIDRLKAVGVPVVAAGGDLSQQTEVRLVMALLNMMVNPGNEHVRADVLHLLDDRSTQDLLIHRLQYLNQLEAAGDGNEPDRRWMDDNPLISSLLSFRQRIVNRSVGDIVQALVYGLDLNEIVAKWGDKDERQQNLDRVIDMAKAYDDHCVQMGIGASVDGFVNHLSSTQAEAKPDNSAQAVKVLTYHKAKGLEWNYVILCSLDKDALEEQEFAKKDFWGVRVLRQADSNYAIQYLPRIWDSIKTNLSQYIISKISGFVSMAVLRALKQQELCNLLYVGMTRARDYLTTTSNQGHELKWVSNARIASGEVSNLWGDASWQPQVESVAEPADNLATDVTSTSQRIAYPEYKAVSDEPKYLSPSMLMLDEGQDVKVELAASLSNNHMDHGRISEDMEATFGTCIHNIFAVYDPKVSREENVARSERIRNGYYMYDTIPDPSQVIESIELLYEHLTNTYGAAVRVEHEVPFVHVLDGQEVHGEIDLLWYTADDNCVIVDFKNYLGRIDTLLDASNAHYAGRYAPQLAAYRDVLSQSGLNVQASLIYYSVLRVLVSID